MAQQGQEETPRTFSYPLDPNSYKILQEIGNGVSGTVYKAACLPMNSSVVAIKSIDLERSRANLDDLRQETKAMTLLSHPNILKALCSFTVDHHLWVVMPFMCAGSLHSIISSSFPDGLNESSIAVVLKETLNALLYLHDQGHLHRDIKAGNILVDSNGSVKLADFGVSASIYEPNLSKRSSSSSSNLMFNDVAGTPYWMAPEVIHSHTGYSFKADIWSFGITALELAHGRPPLSHLPPGKSLFMRITNRLRFSDFEKNNKKDKNKKFSKNFKDMVASCLDTDPSKRPTAEKLRKHPFFKNCKNSDFLVKSMLQGLPTIEERYRENILRKMKNESDDEESLIGPLEKHRRISGWNFNEDVLKLEPVFPIEREGFKYQNLTHEKDDNVKRVRFGEEMVIQGTNHDGFEENKKNEGGPYLSMPPICFKDEIQVDTDVKEIEKIEVEEQRGIDEAETDVGIEMNEEQEEENLTNTPVEGVMVPIGPLVPGLKAILDGLEIERLLVSDLINRIGGVNIGEMSHEEQLEQMVVQLSLQLDQERRRSSLLEIELEHMRHKIAGNIDQSNHGTSE